MHLVAQSASPFTLAIFGHLAPMMSPFNSAAVALVEKPAAKTSARTT